MDVLRQVFIDSQYQYNKRVLSDNRKWLTIDVIEVCILKIESILCGDSMSHVTHTSNIRKAYKKGTCEKGIIYFILLLRKPNMMISKLWFLNSLCSARYDIEIKMKHMKCEYMKLQNFQIWNQIGRWMKNT